MSLVDALELLIVRALLPLHQRIRASDCKRWQTVIQDVHPILTFDTVKVMDFESVIIVKETANVVRTAHSTTVAVTMCTK